VLDVKCNSNAHTLIKDWVYADGWIVCSGSWEMLSLKLFCVTW